MTPSSAGPDTIATIRRLAEAGRFVLVAQQVRWDMMAHNLTRQDVADTIVEWIDAGGRVKPTVLHSFRDRQGETAYEMKPKIGGTTWYIKVCIEDRDGPDEGLALLSTHPDHG